MRAVLRRVEGAMVVEQPEEGEWWRALKRGRVLEERAMRLATSSRTTGSGGLGCKVLSLSDEAQNLNPLKKKIYDV